MKIKDAAHAVRVLESFVDQMESMEKIGGPRHVKLSLDGDVEGMKFLGARYLMSPALVEGAKAVLETYKKAKEEWGFCEAENPEGYIYESERMVTALAQAYASRMIEAGLTVPE